MGPHAPAMSRAKVAYTQGANVILQAYEGRHEQRATIIGYDRGVYSVMVDARDAEVGTPEHLRLPIQVTGDQIKGYA